MQTMLDIYALRKAYKAQEISNTDFFKISHSPTHGFTKPKLQTELYQLLPKAYHKPKAEQ